MSDTPRTDAAAVSAEFIRREMDYYAHKFVLRENAALRGRISALEQSKGKQMKKIVETVEGEGLDKLLGERVTLFCANYIYTGVLSGVNQTSVLLTNAAVVYETGPFGEKKWKDAQELPADWYVQTSAIESFGLLK